MGYWGNRKPPFGTRINPDHPLSQGLVACWPFNERMGMTAYDAVRSGQAGLTPSTAINPWIGSNFVLPGGSDTTSATAALPAYLQLQPPLSLVWQGTFPTTFTANNAIFGIIYSNPNGSPFFGGYMIGTDSGNGLNWYHNDAGTLRTLLSGVGPGAAGFGKKEQWAGTLTTAAGALYFNSLSKFAGGSALGSASCNYTATSYIGMGGTSWTELVALYSRVIPTAQMDWLRVEPFDHFAAPGTNPVVFLMSPPGGLHRLAGIGGGSAGPYAHLAGNR